MGRELKYNPRETVLSLHDLKALFFRHWQRIALVAVMVAGLFLFFAIRHTPTYTAKASFKVSSGGGEDLLGGAGKVLSVFGAAEEGSGDAIPLMRSRKLMQQVAQNLNLQMAILERGQGSRWKTYGANLYLEGLFLKYQFRRLAGGVVSGSVIVPEREILPSIAPSIACSHILYSGELPLSFTLTFADDETFSIGGHTMLQGAWYLGEEIVTTDLAFSVERAVPGSLAGKVFDIIVFPLSDVAESLSRDLAIATQKGNKKVIELSYRHADRHLASSVVNEVMHNYKTYLKEDNYLKSQEQIAYLEERQDRTNERLETLVRQYTDFLKEDVSAGGFINLNAEVEFLARTQEAYKSRLRQIQLERYIIEAGRKESRIPETMLSLTVSNPILASLVDKLSTLRHEQDSVAIALQRQEDSSHAGKDRPLAEELEQKDFFGLDLPTLQELYIENTQTLSESEARIRQLDYLAVQMGEPGFEISALSSALQDPISNRVIDNAGDLLMRLQDQTTHSIKEHERIREELDLSRRFLQLHVEQMRHLELLRMGVFREKLALLEETKYALLTQEIAIMEKQMQEHLGDSQKALNYEEGLIANQVDEIQGQMAHLPEKWLNESLIDLRTKMNAKTIEEISRLVEAKNISQNLERIESVPLDFSIAPKLPNSPALLLSLLFGGVLGGIGTYGFYVVNALRKGVPASKTTLEMFGQEVIEGLRVDYRASPDGMTAERQEALRSLARRLLASNLGATGSRVVGCVMHRDDDYSCYLAELIARQGKRCCLVQISLENESTRAIKQWQDYFEAGGPLPEVDASLAYDRYVVPGSHLYATEWLSSAQFSSLIERCRMHYAVTVITTFVGPIHSQAEVLLPQADVIAVNVDAETVHDLRSFILKGQESSSQPILFVL